MILEFIGNAPRNKFIRIGVQNNNFTDEINFVFGRKQGNIDLFEYSPKIKISTIAGDFAEYSGNCLTYVTNNDNTVKITYVIGELVTSQGNVNMQIIFEKKVDNITKIWQTIIFNVTFESTINPSKDVTTAYPDIIEKLKTGTQNAIATADKAKKIADDTNIAITSLIDKDKELGNEIQDLRDYNNILSSQMSEMLIKDDILLLKDESGLKYTIKVKDKELYINIPKDRFLKNASYDSETHKINFIFETSNGEEVAFSVDLTDLIDIYTAGEGITLENGKFSVNETIARKTDLETKENKRIIEENSGETVVLESGKEYNCGIRTSLILNLPETINDCFECIVNFKSGTIMPTFDSDARIIYTQDDTLDGLLYPLSNKIYEINIKSVMGKLIAIVNATECEVIS